MDRLVAAVMDVPIITRTWAAAICLVSLLCHLQVLSPFHLYFDWQMITRTKQYWRLLSSFFYFGSLSIDLLFHLFFLIRYCQLLEESSFRNKPADFLAMLLYSAAAIIFIAVLLPGQSLAFLGSPLTFVVVYVWSRRNPFVHMNFLGLVNFQAPFMPWVLVAFGALLHGVPVADLVGILVGHVYWYFEDIYPRMNEHIIMAQAMAAPNANDPDAAQALAQRIHRNRSRRRVFRAPRLLCDLLGQDPPSPNTSPPPSPRPTPRPLVAPPPRPSPVFARPEGQVALAPRQGNPPFAPHALGNPRLTGAASTGRSLTDYNSLQDQGQVNVRKRRLQQLESAPDHMGMNPSNSDSDSEDLPDLERRLLDGHSPSSDE